MIVLSISASGSEINTGQSCNDIQAANKSAVSGIYCIKLESSKPFQVYCDMETYWEGWTLVYSYTFTNYGNFTSPSNAVTPPSKLARPWQECPHLNHSSTQRVVAWCCGLESLEGHWTRVYGQVEH